LANTFKPPAPYIIWNNTKSIFLGGSIEMGAAEDWQSKFTEAFADHSITILNPRRDDWDSSWKQDITDPNFNNQVNWELNALIDADCIVFYFDPNTKSPISLLELGLFARSGKLLVCCPEGFWRRGNVQIVCARWGIPLIETLDELIGLAKLKLAALVPEQNS
jgi:hypothetical protein